MCTFMRPKDPYKISTNRPSKCDHHMFTNFSSPDPAMEKRGETPGFVTLALQLVWSGEKPPRPDRPGRVVFEFRLGEQPKAAADC